MSLFPDRQSNYDEPQVPARRRVLSVTSLNRLARSLLEGNFPAVLVEGEISNFSTPASGHWYLTLKDEKSQLRCAMFRNSNRRLSFRPADGNHILVKGRLSIYEARGDYQLIIDDMEEAGDGALRRSFEVLKAKLAEQGLFDETHKQVVTANYRHVAVITSPTGAAIRDILTVFRRRFPATLITLIPVSVQGSEAAAEIVAALDNANRLAAQLGLDVVLLARGGGSLEDLQPFNEESVALAIHASELPVVCGVGHEIDFTIADLTADLRAPTPSAAAELLSQDQRDYHQTLLAFQQQMTGVISRHLTGARQNLRWTSQRLKHPGSSLQDNAQALDILENRLKRALTWHLQNRKNNLRELRRALVANTPGRKVVAFNENRTALQVRLVRAIHTTVNDCHGTLNQLARSLNAVSPLNTLGRGFSITYGENNVVLRNSDDARTGDLIKTRLMKGIVESHVTRVIQDHEEDN